MKNLLPFPIKVYPQIDNDKDVHLISCINRSRYWHKFHPLPTLAVQGCSLSLVTYWESTCFPTTSLSKRSDEMWPVLSFPRSKKGTNSTSVTHTWTYHSIWHGDLWLSRQEYLWIDRWHLIQYIINRDLMTRICNYMPEACFSQAK